MLFDCQYCYRSSGRCCQKRFDAFCFGAKARRKTLLRMLTKFAEYCEPRTQIIHERFFNDRKQEGGEKYKCVSYT